MSRIHTIVLVFSLLFVAAHCNAQKHGSDIDSPANNQRFLFGTTQVTVGGTITQEDNSAILTTHWPDGSTTTAKVQYGVGHFSEFYAVVNFRPDGSALSKGIYYSVLETSIILDWVFYSVYNPPGSGNPTRQ